MPTYEYACRDCSQHVEVVQSFRDEPLTVCPTCSGRLRKVYAATGIIFKGSGYYSTDSRAAAAKAGNEGNEGNKGNEGKAKGEDGAARETAEKPAAAETKGGAATSESTSSTEPAAKSA